MRSIPVSSERDYEVVICQSWASELSSVIGDQRAIAIVPQRLASQVAACLSNLEIIEAPEGEDQKSLSFYGRALGELSSRRLDRSAVLIGIGGGATTDLTGFLAATYLRGIDWIAIPTTVAGMVDAAIGGKTGLNLDTGKNLVGAFHSPKRVIIDIDWLRTLEPRDRNAGLAEAVKCGFISDPTILDLIEDDLTNNLAEIVARAIAVKARIVSADFRESFAREALNYGHTLGHAIERHSGYSLRHGEAISLGMIFAAHLSAQYSGLEGADVSRHVQVLSNLGLPTQYPAGAWNELFELLQVDKKRRGSKVRFVTLPRIGATDRLESPSQAELAEIYFDSIAR